MDRAVHAGYIRAVSPGTDPHVYLDARKERYQSHHFSGGRVRDASPTTFLAHLPEK